MQTIQETLPDLQIASDGASLFTESKEPILSTQPCEGNLQVEVNLAMEPGSRAGVLMNAHDMHDGFVSAVAISADDLTIATGSIDGKSIFVWDAQTGDAISQFKANDKGTSGIAFSLDSKTIYSTADGNLRVWSLTDLKLSQTIPLPIADYWSETMFATGPPVLVSPDGKHLFVGVGDGEKCGRVLQYALPELTLVATFARPSPGLTRLACDQECKTIVAVTSEAVIQVWDVATATLRTELTSPPQSEIVSIALNGSGEQLAVSFPGGLIHLYATDTLSNLATLQGFEAGCYALAYDPTGKTLAAGYENGTIKVWIRRR